MSRWCFILVATIGLVSIHSSARGRSFDVTVLNSDLKIHPIDQSGHVHITLYEAPNGEELWSWKTTNLGSYLASAELLTFGKTQVIVTLWRQGVNAGAIRIFSLTANPKVQLLLEKYSSGEVNYEVAPEHDHLNIELNTETWQPSPDGRFQNRIITPKNFEWRP